MILEELKTYWTFLKLLFVHKWYVFIYGARLKVPLANLIFHDLSKLYSISELVGFMDKVRADRRVGRRLKAKTACYALPRFKNAVRLHTIRRRHHWQHWLYIDSRKSVFAAEMPEDAAREMVADWMAAGMTYNGTEDARGWYELNKHKMILHKSTKAFIESILC